MSLWNSCSAEAGPSHIASLAHNPFAIYRWCYLTTNEPMELQAYYAQSGLDCIT